MTRGHFFCPGQLVRAFHPVIAGVIAQQLAATNIPRDAKTVKHNLRDTLSDLAQVPINVVRTSQGDARIAIQAEAGADPVLVSAGAHMYCRAAPASTNTYAPALDGSTLYLWADPASVWRQWCRHLSMQCSALLTQEDLDKWCHQATTLTQTDDNCVIAPNTPATGGRSSGEFDLRVAHRDADARGIGDLVVYLSGSEIGGILASVSSDPTV